MSLNNPAILLACLFIQFFVDELSDGRHPLSADTFAWMRLIIGVDVEELRIPRVQLLLAHGVATRFLREQGILPEVTPDIVIEREPVIEPPDPA